LLAEMGRGCNIPYKTSRFGLVVVHTLDLSVQLGFTNAFMTTLYSLQMNDPLSAKICHLLL